MPLNDTDPYGIAHVLPMPQQTPFERCERCRLEVNPKTKMPRMHMKPVDGPCRRCGNELPQGSIADPHSYLVRHTTENADLAQWIRWEVIDGVRRMSIPSDDLAAVLWGMVEHAPWHSHKKVLPVMADAPKPKRGRIAA